jgi:hypothetical protein
MSIVTGFVFKLRKGRKMIGHLLAEGKLRFTVFKAVMDSSVLVADGDDHPPDGAKETNLVTYF